MCSDEEWRTIPHTDGYYEASDHGRIRSVPRTVPHPRSGKLTLAGRVLKPVPMKDGHLQVSVRFKGSRTRPHLVHRLVLLAFVGDPPTGTEGCHKNGDPADNRLGNLRWDTRGSNIADAIRHGTSRWSGRETCGAGHALIGPNIRNGGAKRCRSCALARTWARHLLQRKGIEVTPVEIQQEADRRFQLLSGRIEEILR